MHYSKVLSLDAEKLKNMSQKADTQLCTFLIENMTLRISYWANFCDKKPNLGSLFGAAKMEWQLHVLYISYIIPSQK